MNKVVVKRSEDHEVWCYGEIEEDSNFACVFEDEIYDGIVADIDTTIYKTWEQIVNRICENYNPHLEEISTC